MNKEQKWKDENGRIAYIIRSGYGDESWEGVFDDNHSMLYYARYKEEILSDMNLVERIN
jgi:hypothetical protein